MECSVPLLSRHFFRRKSSLFHKAASYLWSSSLGPALRRSAFSKVIGLRQHPEGLYICTTVALPWEL